MAAPAYRTTAPVRHLLFAVGSLLAVAMVGWGTAQAIDRLSIQEERVVSSYAGVTAIDLRHAHGDVTLVRAPGRRVRVEVDSRYGAIAGHDRDVQQAAGELRLRGSCDFLTIGTCEEDYRIEVPRGVQVTVRTSAGRALARGLRGSLDMRSSAGPVEAFDVHGPYLTLQSRAGPVRAVRVRARGLELESVAGPVGAVRSIARDVRAGTSAGSVDVELLRPPRLVDASARAGSVTVRVPDVGYAIDAQASAGEEDVQVRNRPGSRRSILVRSRAGVVRVLPLAGSGATRRDRR